MLMERNFAGGSSTKVNAKNKDSEQPKRQHENNSQKVNNNKKEAKAQNKDTFGYSMCLI